jgi:hypothetical protein
MAGNLNTVQNQDSTILFDNITDISRQIEQRTANRNESQVDTIINIQNDDIILQDLNKQNDSIEVETDYDQLQEAEQQEQPEKTEQTEQPEQPEQPEQTIQTPEPIVTPTPTAPRRTSMIRRNILDDTYKRSANGTLQLPEYHYDYNVDRMRGLTFRDTLFYNPLYLPMIFTGDVLPRDLSLYKKDTIQNQYSLIPKEKTFAPNLEKADFVQKIRKNYYSNYPDKIVYSSSNFTNLPTVAETNEEVKENFNPLRELLKSETSYSLEAPGVDITTIKRKYWIRSGEHSFQFSQNRFSENWHRGGTNNLNFNSYNVIRANYDKNRVKFNNTLEWRLSLFNSPDDTIRQYRIGNDLLRYYGDLGLDAFLKKWSYSMNLEIKTQVFNNYPTNSNELRSAFLAPLYINSGIGLKYNLDKKSEKVRHRRIRWDLALAPISINYRYVGNSKVDVQRYGIEEGKKSLLDIGSTITSIVKYDITRYVTWDSRLTYFTSYDKVISEFENGLNLSLSNAFSTRIYLDVRFDDSVPKDDKLGFWQYNQTLSFGLNYKW